MTGHLLTGLRPAIDADAAALAALVGGVYAEYPGCVLDLPGVDADLCAIATVLAAKNGLLWVLPADDGLIACGGYAETEVAGGRMLELKRLYVRADHRGRGIGTALAGRVLAVAAARQIRVVELWSDTRFADAHRLYERLGFARQARTRELHDPSNTTEYHYVLQRSDVTDGH